MQGLLEKREKPPPVGFSKPFPEEQAGGVERVVTRDRNGVEGGYRDGGTEAFDVFFTYLPN